MLIGQLSAAGVAFDTTYIKKTTLETYSGGSGIDSLDQKDLTGNGFMDYCYADQNGKVYLQLQNTKGVFTEVVVRSSTISGADMEHCSFVSFTNDGNYQIVCLSYGSDDSTLSGDGIYVFYPDTPGDYDGSWSMVQIDTNGYASAQDGIAVDLDDDGSEEFMFAYEGTGSVTGGVTIIKLTGTDVSKSADYTFYDKLTGVKGPWWFTRETRNIGGRDVYALSMRQRSYYGTADAGMYLWKPPTSGNKVTGTWDLEKIHTDTDGCSQVYWASIYSNDDKDLVYRNTYAKILNYSNSWAEETVDSNATNADLYTRHSIIPAPWQYNGRDVIVTMGLGGIAAYCWSGNEWEAYITDTFGLKSNDYLAWEDVDGDGWPELFFTESQNLFEFGYVDIHN